MNLLFIPVFRNTSEVNNHIIRSSWYLIQEDIESINFLVDFSVNIDGINIPKYFNKNCYKYIEQMKDKFQFINIKDLNKVNNIIKKSEIILNWNKNTPLPSEVNIILKESRNIKKSYIVDTLNHRNEGTAYIQIGTDNWKNKEVELKNLEKKFKEIFSKKYSKYKKSTLFGTGPSLQEYKNFSFNDSLNIACNSIVKDVNFFQSVRPDIIVFADPIFHFGCSSYTEQFSEHLLNMAEKFEFDIVIPFKYWHLFKKLYPSLIERTYPIPMEKTTKPNFDLFNNYSVKNIDNIFTLLMFPIGCYFTDEINLIGFDGNPDTSKSYFWKHNKQAQFNKELEEIQKIHPAFFNVNFEEYNNNHIKNVEQYFHEAEKHGKEIYSLTESHIESIKNRYVPKFDFSNLSNIKDRKNITFISINSDMDSKIGHFYNYDFSLSEAAKKLDFKFLSLVNKNFNDDEGGLNAIPTFSKRFTEIKNIKSEEKILETINTFTTNLSKRIEEINNNFPNDKKVYFIYIGSSEQLTFFYSKIIKKLDKNTFFYINLFNFHDEFYLNKFNSDKLEFFIKYYIKNLQRANFYFFVDSFKLQKYFYDKFNFLLDIWPIMFINKEDKVLSNSENNKNLVRLLYPGKVEKIRGSETLLKLSEFLSKNNNILNESTPNEICIDFKIKTNLNYNQSNLQILKESKHTVEIDYSTKNFDKLFEDSDIVIIPYNPRVYETRTSGIFADAVIHNKPIISTKNSWVGNLIDDYNIGCTYEENDLNSLIAAINNVVKNFKDYKNNLIEFSKNNYFITSENLLKNFNKLSTNKNFIKLSNNFTEYEKIYAYLIINQKYKEVISQFIKVNNIKDDNYNNLEIVRFNENDIENNNDIVIQLLELEKLNLKLKLKLINSIKEQEKAELEKNRKVKKTSLFSKLKMKIKNAVF
jgi:hypothetical protein